MFWVDLSFNISMHIREHEVLDSKEDNYQMNHSRTVVQRKCDENRSLIFPRSS